MDKKTTIILIVFALFILGFCGMVRFWWGTTPVYQGKTLEGLTIRYLPHPFCNPNKPRIKYVIAENHEFGIEFRLYVNGCDIPYSDSSRVNSVADNFFSDIMTFGLRDVNEHLPKKYTLNGITVPEKLWQYLVPDVPDSTSITADAIMRRPFFIY